VRDGVVAYGTTAIYGAHLGTDPTGTLGVPNGICGVYLGSGHDHAVGGPVPGSGNLISGNKCGVQAEVTTRRGAIVSNKIGTDISGTTAIPNLVGIRASIDSTGSGINIAGNLVSGNTNVGIENLGLETTIVGNFVGTDVSGTAPLPNFRGIILWNPGTAIIGGTGLSDPNTIAYNTREGIVVWSGAYGAARISRNSIFGNGRIGIDLGGDGVTYNDAPFDDDIGPNGLQNFPTIVSAVLSEPDSLTVSYEFQSDFSGYQYEIEFFVSSTPDDTGFGEGQKFVASQTVYPILGYVSVTDLGLVSPSFKTGLWLTMTATNPFSSNETSEFSEAVQITGPSVDLAAAKVFLEGPYAGGSMSTALLGGGFLPINQPFADPLFDGTLSEYDDVVAVSAFPDDAVDWVTLSLRSDPSAGSEVKRRVAFVRNDGILMDFDGSATVQFPDIATLNYYLVVCQRNHICAMSSSPVDFVSTSGIGTWDFTTAMTQAFTIGGAPMMDLGGGVYGLFAADNNADGQVTAPDFNQWNAETTAGAAGYKRADHDLDGLVTAPDFNLWNANTTAGASSKVPN